MWVLVTGSFSDKAQHPLSESTKRSVSQPFVDVSTIFQKDGRIRLVGPEKEHPMRPVA